MPTNGIPKLTLCWWLLAACLSLTWGGGGGGGGTARAAAEAERPPAEQAAKRQYYPAGSSGNPTKASPTNQKCARQSITLARQVLAHELAHMNQFNSIWFNDLDKDELLEGQKHSLSNIVMSGAGTSLLNSNGQPLIEIESSYFRHAGQPIAMRLLKRHHQDKCFLTNGERRQFTYVFGLSLGPIEHHLDVIYNLPKDLSLSQPLDWRYAHIGLALQRMNYEITLRQAADHTRIVWPPVSFSGSGACPLEVADVTYLPGGGGGGANSPISIQSFGLALNNQTLLQVERLFDDYTRPTISHRLRQMLKFYLNTKTLPLAPAASDY